MAAVRQLWTPPHSIEAERALLGALLSDPKAWPRIAGRVGAADFFREGHARIFEAIEARARRGDTWEPLGIAAALVSRDALERSGGSEYLAELVDDAPLSSAAAESYADTVRDLATRRRLFATGEAITRLVRTPSERSADDLLADASKLLQSLTAGTRTAGKGLVDARTLVEELIDDLERRRQGAKGLAVGLPDFDGLTSGLEGGDLVIVAARPGMGKTALLVSMAAHVARDTGVAVFSAEMPSMQLMRRCVALLGEISQTRLRKPADLTDHEWDRIGDAAVAIASRRLWIDDASAPTLAHLRAETLALAARHELGLVLVDYTQLVKGEGANRYEQLRDVAYGLKALAKETGAPVVALAQLNREVEKRDNKRPNIGDLRDSGAIEEAADMIAMLYCEGYYDPEFGMPYVIEANIAKNRNGPKGLCLWHMAGEYSRVGTLDSAAAAQYRHHLSRQRRRNRAEDDDL